MKKRVLVAVIVLILAGLLLVWSKSCLPPSQTEQNFNVFSLDLEIADTEAERIKGLSERESLGEMEGMLFVFERERKWGIWMKDMRFSIDIAWLDSNKKIIYIERDVFPDTYPKVFYPPSPARFVLEANSGFFYKHQLFVGDVLETKGY